MRFKPLSFALFLAACRTAEPGAPSLWQLEIVPRGDAPAKVVVNWVDAAGTIVRAALATLSCGRSTDVTSTATTCANADLWGARLDPSTQSAQLWGPQLSAVDLGCKTLASGVTICQQRISIAP